MGANCSLNGKILVLGTKDQICSLNLYVVSNL